MAPHDHGNGQIANISQGEWNDHCRKLDRTSTQIGELALQLKRTNASLDLVGGQLRQAILSMNAFRGSIEERVTRHSDWQETTAKHDREKLEEELKTLREKDDRRIASWIKWFGVVAAALTEAAILHWLRW